MHCAEGNRGVFQLFPSVRAAVWVARAERSGREAPPAALHPAPTFSYLTTSVTTSPSIPRVTIMPHRDQMQQGLEGPTRRYFRFIAFAVFALMRRCLP